MTLDEHRAARAAAEQEATEARRARNESAEALDHAERAYDAAPSVKAHAAAVWTARQARDLAEARLRLASERRDAVASACEAFEAATVAAAAVKEAEALRAAQQARFAALAPEIGRAAYLRQIGPHVGRILDLRDALAAELAACAELAIAQQEAAVEAAALAAVLGEPPPAPVEGEERPLASVLGAPAMVRYAVHGAALARPLAPDAREELLSVLAVPESAPAILASIFARYRTTDTAPHVPPAAKLSLVIEEGLRSPSLLRAERRALALESYQHARACNEVVRRGVLAAKLSADKVHGPLLAAEERADVDRWIGEGAAEHARRVASFKEACAVGYGPDRGPGVGRATITLSDPESTAQAWWSFYHADHGIPDPGHGAFASFYHSEVFRILATASAAKRSGLPGGHDARGMEV